MIIEVKVKTSSRKEFVNKVSENTYEVSVNVPPIEGKANSRVIEMLSEYFNIPKSKIILKRGEKSKIKLFEIIT